MNTVINPVDSVISYNDKLIKKVSLFLVVSLVVFTSWGTFSTLHSASIASGVVIVKSKKKNIQHLEGGIVSKVFVEEGQKVHKGDPLIKIDDIASISKLKQTRLTLIGYKLQYQRLLAEREHRDVFIPQVFSHSAPQVEHLIENQKALFNSRVGMRKKELSILDSRLSGARAAKTSSEKMITEKQLALQYLDEEIEMHEKLLSKGYTSKQKLLELKRTEVSLRSDIISMQANIDDQNSTISELIKQKKAVRERNISDIEGQLAEVRNQLLQLESDYQTQQDLQTRTIIRSPSDGVVMGMKVNTSGEVISPGETVMEIVPNHDSLIIEGLIKPTDIDVVEKGQKAMVRLTAYNYRTTPMIKGVVMLVDADRTVEQQGNRDKVGYKVQVKLDEEDLKNNPEVNLYPGMPVEIYILNKEKSPIEYLIEPFENSLSRAFREN